MDFLNNYFTTIDAHAISVSAEQGSAFAKQVADDFNPIHHPDSRRFCVPGDLLFAIAVARYGLRTQMTFRFLDLLSADVTVHYPESVTADNHEQQILNAAGKPTLGLQQSGAHSDRASQKESLIKNYVAFSGHNFPDILVPLMREQNVMFNPQRPLVIYQDMHLEFNDFDFSMIDVALAETALEVSGKRGDAKLYFRLLEGERVVGKGYKTLILSGLREYDETAVQAMREEYIASKAGSSA